MTEQTIEVLERRVERLTAVVRALSDTVQRRSRLAGAGRRWAGKRTADGERLLLVALRNGVPLAHAAARIGVTKQTVLNWKRRDEQFAGELRAAQRAGGWVR